MDRNAHMQGPFGTNTLDVARYGMCPIDSAKFSHDDLHRIGKCVMEAFNDSVDAQIMWTFRNELEPRWSFLESYDAGWIKPQEAHAEIHEQHHSVAVPEVTLEPHGVLAHAVIHEHHGSEGHGLIHESHGSETHPVILTHEGHDNEEFMHHYTNEQDEQHIVGSDAYHYYRPYEQPHYENYFDGAEEYHRHQPEDFNREEVPASPW